MAPWQRIFAPSAVGSGTWDESVVLETVLGNWSQMCHIIIAQVSLWLEFLKSAALDDLPGKFLCEASAQQDKMGLKSILGASFLCQAALAACTNGSYTKDGLTWSSKLRMNQVQVIGTHNSYHVESSLDEKPVQALLMNNVENFWYAHPSLDIQLEYQSVRNLELDVYADPEGSKYATPLIRKLAHLPFPSEPSWNASGIKVFHVADADVNTSCNTLIGCLKIVKAWSDAHPDHVPIPFMVEFKTAGDDTAYLGGATPLAWNNTELLAGIDDEIRSVFGEDQLITPDHIRREGMTLEESVLEYGWPDLESARGRVFFLMDNGPVHPIRDTYTLDKPNLEGRVIFTNSAPGNSDCAFQKLNEPRGDEQQANIQAQVKAGYWVRTRSDVPLETLLSNDTTTMREMAFSSGAQIVSTDFPSYGMSDRWHVSYAVRFPGGKSARCNPINAPDGCAELELEPAEYTQH